MKWILSLEFDHFAIPKPDLNVFLDVPFSFTERKLLSNRSGNDRTYLNGIRDIHEESLNFQKRVRDIYLEVARSDDRLAVVDCRDRSGLMQSPEAIFSLILKLIRERGLI
jgi:dTMP kinase